MLDRVIACLILLAPPIASAQLEELQGLNGLQDVALSELSRQDDNPLGKTALALHPEEWKHAEGEHFIYHYARNFVASRLAVEAEFNLRVVMKELGKEEPRGTYKSHIYIFERAEDWQAFQKAGGLEPWTGGIHSAGSLFVQRDPAYKFSGHTLGHEIAHLLIYKYYGSRIPRWLNEGFAEYVSRNSRASYQRARGYISKPRSNSLAPAALIPLSQLMAAQQPPSHRVETFYDEAERLVRFLVSTDKGRFLTLLDSLGHGEQFEQIFLCDYAGIFSNQDDFEAKFRDYASKDFGTTLQDSM